LFEVRVYIDAPRRLAGGMNWPVPDFTYEVAGDPVLIYDGAAPT
jgi:hypothetical protein